MEIEEKYGQLDLKQFMNGRNHIKAIQQDVNPPEILHGSQMHYPRLFPDELHPICGYRNPNSDQHYGMDGSGGNGMVFPPSRFDLCPCDSSSLTKCGLAAVSKNPSEYSGGGRRFEEFEEGGDGGNSRWPRHETLTLLDIRSKMDSMFREANQKGPLWDELSRILAEEHGYQRSGKKCREKFENLYKYYKKTKEGKAGRQDGKHYRFFNQLEALYGGTNNCAPDKNPTRLGIKHSDSSDSETSSSHDVKNRRSWKSKIKMFVDVQMKKLVEKQEEWLENVVETLERKEEERILREEEWRNQETARFDREHKFWANERAWLEARDVALMGALHKVIGLQQQQQQHMVVSPADSTAGLSDNDAGTHNSNSCNNKRWPENGRKTAVETRFQESSSKGNIWDEISNQMDQLGYDRSTKRCKENSLYSSLEKNEKIPVAVGYHPSQESSPTDSNARVEQEDCFRIPISDQTGVENLWESYMFMLTEKRIGSVRRE